MSLPSEGNGGLTPPAPSPWTLQTTQGQAGEGVHTIVSAKAPRCGR